MSGPHEDVTGLWWCPSCCRGWNDEELEDLVSPNCPTCSAELEYSQEDEYNPDDGLDYGL